MKTVPFQESYRQTFIDLNSRWILDNFGRLAALRPGFI